MDCCPLIASAIIFSNNLCVFDQVTIDPSVVYGKKPIAFSIDQASKRSLASKFMGLMTPRAAPRRRYAVKWFVASLTPCRWDKILWATPAHPEFGEIHRILAKNGHKRRQATPAGGANGGD